MGLSVQGWRVDAIATGLYVEWQGGVRAGERLDAAWSIPKMRDPSGGYAWEV